MILTLPAEGRASVTPSAKSRHEVYGKRGRLVRLAYLTCALIWWVLTGLGRLGRHRAIVLCYHSVTAEQQHRLEWQMRRIAGRTVSTSDLAKTCGGIGGPPRVCVTFDDGFACLLRTALRVMKEQGIPAIVFPVLENLGSTPKWSMPEGHPEAEELVMTAEEIAMAQREGLCRFGSHTLTHPALADLPPAGLQQELVESKKALERLMGDTVEDLALPYGSYNDNVVAAAKAAGYTRIFTLNPTLYVTPDRDGLIGRFSMSPDVWRIEFLLTCAGAYSWLYYWRKFLRRMRTVFGARTQRAPQHP